MATQVMVTHVMVSHVMATQVAHDGGSGHLLAVSGAVVLALLLVAAVVVGAVHLGLLVRRRSAVHGHPTSAAGLSSWSWRTAPAAPRTAASPPSAETTTDTGDQRLASTRRAISTSTDGAIHGARVE